MNNHLIAPEGHYFANHDRSLIASEIYLSQYDAASNYDIISQAEHDEIMKEREEQERLDALEREQEANRVP